MPKRDSLSRMIDRADRERARPSRIEPERLILPARPDVTTRRICVQCRQRPTLNQFRDRWLADNPPPPPRCVLDQNGYVCFERKEHGRICDNCIETGKNLHLIGMSDAASTSNCPTCDGLLVEIVW